MLKPRVVVANYSKTTVKLYDYHLFILWHQKACWSLSLQMRHDLSLKTSLPAKCCTSVSAQHEWSQGFQVVTLTQCCMQALQCIKD